MLDEMTRRANGALIVILRGRPALDQMPNFHEVVAASPWMSFGGSYAADDLPSMYADVHFAWAVDYFDEGKNSDWLLPNRLYEAGAYGVPVIVRAGTEAARWALQKKLGIALDWTTARPAVQLNAAQYREICQALAAGPDNSHCHSPETCRIFVDLLSGSSPRNICASASDLSQSG